MNRSDNLFPITEMNDIFKKIEDTGSVDISEEDRQKIMSSMSKENNEMIREATEYEINLFLLREIYKTQKMAEMLGPSKISEDLEEVAIQLEEEIESQSDA